jgi:polyhydroxybutyrate depolymerase
MLDVIRLSPELLLPLVLGVAACKGDAPAQDAGETGTGSTSGDPDSSDGPASDGASAETSGTASDETSVGTTDASSTSEGGSTSGSGSDETGGTGDTDGGIPPTSPACGQPLDPNWLSNYQLEFGGTTQATSLPVSGAQRDFIVALPDNYDPNVAYPIHFVFHAWRADMDGAHGQHPENGWNEPIIAVAPRGQAVQGGGYGWEWWETSGADYAFFDAMLADIGEHACVDNQRIFLQGHSNGAYFAQMLACLRGDFVRGVASSSGAMPIDAAACQGPVGAFLINGTADTVVPIAEARGARDRWLTLNGCANTTQPHGDQCVQYDDCSSAPVVWCEHPGGHPESGPWSLGLTQVVIDLLQSL